MQEAAFFRTLDEKSLKLAAGALVGREVPGDADTLRRSIEEALSRPERLRAIVEALPRAGRRTLEVLCEAGGPLYEPYVVAELDRALGNDAERGRRALADARLLCRTRRASWGEAVGTYPPLAIKLLPLFDADWRARERPKPLAADDESSFGAAVLLAHLASARPQVTVNGSLHSRERKRLKDLLPSIPAERVDQWLALLGGMGLWWAGRDGRARVDVGRCQKLLGDPHGMGSARFSGALLNLQPGQWGALELLARRPGRHAFEDVSRAFRLATARFEADKQWSTRPEMSRLAASLRYCLDRMAALDLVDFDDQRGTVRLSKELGSLLASLCGKAGSEVSPRQERICHVQPSFEVIVPPEAGPVAAFDLARFCTLVRLDAVVTLSITAQSVRAAVGQGMDARQVIETLDRLCAHGVPPNVARSVEDFATDVPMAHVLTGVVVYAPGIDLSRLDGKLLRPSGLPDLYVAELLEQHRVCQALGRLGIGVSETRRPSDGWSSPEEEGANAGALLARLVGCLGSHAESGQPLAPPAPTEAPRIMPAADGSVPAAPAWGSVPFLDVLTLSMRAENALLSDGVETLGQLVRLTPRDLLRAKNCGKRTVREIEEALSAIGLGLEMSEAEVAAAVLRGAPIDDSSSPLPDSEALLLQAALPHAEKTWLAHVEAVWGERLVGREDRSSEHGVQILLQGARDGYPCCGVLPLFGEGAVRAALRDGHDLLVLPAGSAEPLQLTPHDLGIRGREPFLAGHLAGTEEDHVYGLDSTLVARGPRSSAADRKRMVAATGSHAAAKVGRNSPCPCGSGKKYKRCCLGAPPPAGPRSSHATP